MTLSVQMETLDWKYKKMADMGFFFIITSLRRIDIKILLTDIKNALSHCTATSKRYILCCARFIFVFYITASIDCISYVEWVVGMAETTTLYTVPPWSPCYMFKMCLKYAKELGHKTAKRPYDGSYQTTRNCPHDR